MNSDEAVPTGLPQGRLQGRSVFQQAVRDALQTAAREGWNEIIVCDADFATGRWASVRSPRPCRPGRAAGAAS